MSEMNRPVLKTKINNIARFLTYPDLDDLHAIDDHDAIQRQRIAQLEAEVKDALECVYIPGVWACNQCEFQLIASNLYVQDGTIGPDTDTVPLCPNDGALMRRVTWKERVSGLDKYAGERLDEIDTLKAEVARLQEWKRIVEGTGTNQEAVIRMAAAEYTKVAVQCWKDKVKELTEQITYLQTVSTEQVERIRALEPKDWTDEKPTVPGWYWWRQSACDCHTEVVVQIDVMFGSWIVNFQDGSNRPYSDVGGQWQGPIAPEEP